MLRIVGNNTEVLQYEFLFKYEMADKQQFPVYHSEIYYINFNITIQIDKTNSPRI